MDFRLVDVELDGKVYPVFFNVIALMKFAKLSEKSLDDLLKSFTDNLDVLSLMPLFHLGLKYGAKKKGIDFTLTVDDVEDLLAIDSKALNAMTEAMMESMPKAQELAVEDSNEKKTVPAAS